MATALTITIGSFELLSMAEGIKETLLDSFRQLLRPLVRILLRNGVSYSEYSETSKIVFVEVAGRDFRQNDEAAMATSCIHLPVSPCPRLIVSNLSFRRRDRPSTQNLNRIGRLLGAWHQDPEFTGPYGLPLELDLDNRTNSFSALVQQYGGGIPPQEMLAELKRIRVISELPGEKVRVLTRSYIPEQSDSAVFQFMGVSLRDLAETLDLNLNDNENEGYFERRVWTPLGIDARDIPAFEDLVDRKAMEFLETLDNWLTSKESDAEKMAPQAKVKVGVGVYLFSDANRSIRED